jgi:hypothetical protein
MLRDIVIFLAGVAFLHTISHFMLPYYVSLPLQTNMMTLTATGNIWVIVISAIVTVLLLLLAKWMKK